MLSKRLLPMNEEGLLGRVSAPTMQKEVVLHNNYFVPRPSVILQGGGHQMTRFQSPEASQPAKSPSSWIIRPSRYSGANKVS